MHRAIHRRLAGCSFLTVLLSNPMLVVAEEITELVTVSGQASPLEITVNNQVYQWGAGVEQVLESLTVDGRRFEVAASADRVEVVRDDIAGIASGEPCGLYVERVDQSPTRLSTSYPGDGSGSGNCDMASILKSQVINRGTLDIFANTAPAPKNIERVDIIFSEGLLAPVNDDSLSLAGYFIGEKRGNNPVQVASIVALDNEGKPASYGPLTRINPAGCKGSELCYSVTDISHPYAFFQSSSLAPQGFPLPLENSMENVAVAFISARTLGLTAGQLFYGMSIFPEDVTTAAHSLVDPSTFPDNTQDDQVEPGDGADIMGGVSSWYVAEPVSQVSTLAFLDANANGLPDTGESGISDITLSLFTDTDGDGVLDKSVDQPVASPVVTNAEGGSLFTGLLAGSYLLELDVNDTDIPSATSLVSVNPVPFSVSGGESQSLFFAFTADVGQPPEPVANPDSFTINLPAGFEITAPTESLDVLANDTDPLGQGLTLSSVSGSNNATIAIVGNQVSYTPNPGFLGSDTFLYTLTDGNGVAKSASVGVLVTSTLDPRSPQAINDTFTITVVLGEATNPTNFAVLDNDIDRFAAGLVIANPPVSPNATITVNPDNSLDYTPLSDAGGRDEFSYTLQDGQGLQSTATVVVNINVVGNPDPESVPVIETEVHGTGLGSLRQVPVFVLLLVLLMRLASKRPEVMGRWAVK